MSGCVSVFPCVSSSSWPQTDSVLPSVTLHLLLIYINWRCQAFDSPSKLQNPDRLADQTLPVTSHHPPSAAERCSWTHHKDNVWWRADGRLAQLFCVCGAEVLRGLGPSERQTDTSFSHRVLLLCCSSAEQNLGSACLWLMVEDCLHLWLISDSTCHCSCSRFNFFIYIVNLFHHRINDNNVLIHNICFQFWHDCLL